MRSEFINTWKPRLLEMIADGHVFKQHEQARFERGVDELLGDMYDAFNNLPRSPPSDLMQGFESLGRLTMAFLDEYHRSMIPASACLDDVHITTMKQLHAVLRDHPEIRRRKPSPQRLMVHAADLERFRLNANHQVSVALDAAADFGKEAKKRQVKLRQRKTQ